MLQHLHLFSPEFFVTFQKCARVITDTKKGKKIRGCGVRFEENQDHPMFIFSTEYIGKTGKKGLFALYCPKKVYSATEFLEKSSTVGLTHKELNSKKKMAGCGAGIRIIWPCLTSIDSQKQCKGGQKWGKGVTWSPVSIK